MRKHQEVEGAEPPGLHRQRAERKRRDSISGMRIAKSSVKETKITMIGQRDGNGSARPRQNSVALSAISERDRHEDSTMR